MGKTASRLHWVHSPFCLMLSHVLLHSLQFPEHRILIPPLLPYKPFRYSPAFSLWVQDFHLAQIHFPDKTQDLLWHHTRFRLSICSHPDSLHQTHRKKPEATSSFATLLEILYSATFNVQSFWSSVTSHAQKKSFQFPIKVCSAMSEMIGLDSGIQILV